METGQWGAGSWAADDSVPDPSSTPDPRNYATGGAPAWPPRTGTPPVPDQRAAQLPYPSQAPESWPRNAPPQPADPRSDSWLNPYPGDRSGTWSDSGARRAGGEHSGSWYGANRFDDLSLADPEPTADSDRWARTYGRPRPARGNPAPVSGHPPRAGDGYPTGLRPVPSTPVYRGSFPMRRINPVSTPLAERPDYRRATIFTAAWYGVPVLLYLAWALTLEASRRTFVLHQLGTNFIWLLGAAVLSLVLGLALRWVAHEWRNLTVSFAAAVMGSGFATVIHTLVNGS